MRATLLLLLAACGGAAAPPALSLAVVGSPPAGATIDYVSLALRADAEQVERGGTSTDVALLPLEAQSGVEQPLPLPAGIYRSLQFCGGHLRLSGTCNGQPVDIDGDVRLDLRVYSWFQVQPGTRLVFTLDAHRLLDGDPTERVDDALRYMQDDNRDGQDDGFVPPAEYLGE